MCLSGQPAMGVQVFELVGQQVSPGFHLAFRIRFPKNDMKQSIVHVALVVKDYDEAIAFYTQKLNFELIEDTYQPEQDKRWIVVSPPGSKGVTLLLARASKPEQEPFVGNQSGGRVFLFLNTDDFWRDYNEMISKGVKFVREPKKQEYGMVAVDDSNQEGRS